MTTIELHQITGGTGSSVVLIGDDNETFRTLLAETLSAAGYFVVEAGDGEEVVVIAQQTPLHLMLLDVKMPKFSGLDAYRRIRTEGKRAPAVFLTTGPTLDVVQQARLLGAIAMLDKLNLRLDEFRKLVFAITHGGPLTDLMGLVGMLLNPLTRGPLPPTKKTTDEPREDESTSTHP